VRSSSAAAALPRPLTFCLVGASGVGVNTSALVILHSGLHVPLSLAAVVATEMAIVSNFSANNALTFRGPRWSLRRLAQFNIASLCAGVIAVGILTALVEATGMHYVLAALMGTAAGAVFNYATSVRLVWAGVPNRLRRESATGPPTASSVG
jgi:dolichol-phosphate mannosyltransferase